MPSDRSLTTVLPDGEDQDVRATRKGGNPLQRGSACLSCRKRKMKCDATKPVCRQCVKANRVEECDYDDGRQKSRTQILQEKIAKLEDRIRELETAEAEQLSLSDDQEGYNDPTAADYDYDTFGAQTTIPGQGLGDELAYHDAGNGAAYHHASSGSPAGSGSGSGSDSSHNAHPMPYSPLALDGSNSVLSYNPSPGLVAAPSAIQYTPQPHQEHQHNEFYPTQEIAVPNTNEMFGYNLNIGLGLGMGMNMEMGYDPSSLAMGLNTGAHHMSGINMDMSVHPGMNLGMNSSMASHDPNASLSVPAYSTHNFSPFTGSTGSSPSTYSNASPSGANAISGTSSMNMRPPPQAGSFLSSGSIQGSINQPLGMGASSLSLSGGKQTMPGQSISVGATLASTSKGKRPMSRWDADVLPIQERKILVDIFLPHARQCGVYLSSERLYQRLELDSAYPSLFPPTQTAQGDLRAPPAHPALANAIYLLACHFSSVHIPGTASPQFSNLSGKQTDLSTHESQFLTRALRGIAAALEAGEAAASDSMSSRSSRSARSRSRSTSASASMRGSASPPTFSTSSPASRFQSASRPRTGNPGPSGSGSGSGVGSSVVTGLGGGVKEDPPDAATPLVDAVQASALLAVYFFAKARLLEGYYHASAAARLAVSLGMHQVKSPVWRPPVSSSFQPGSIGSSAFDPSGSSSSSTSFAYTSSSDQNAGSWSGSPTPSPAVLLPPARCALEHAERVSTFWHVFFIDRCWSVATGLPSSLPDDEHPQLKISTVWPWDAEPGKELTREIADYESLGSLFVPEAPSRHGGKNKSTKALKAKAAAFFERAARIASLQAEPTQWEQLTQLEVALDKFIASLPPYAIVSATVQDPTIDPDLALVHTLTHASIIQLHHPRAQKDAHAHAVCVRAAAACVQIIRCLSVKEFLLLDPVIGTCWMCVSDVLLRERIWGGNMSAVHGVARNAGEGQCATIETELDAVVGALKQLSYVFPVALYQVQKVEQSRNTPYCN